MKIKIECVGCYIQHDRSGRFSTPVVVVQVVIWKDSEMVQNPANNTTVFNVTYRENPIEFTV